MISGSDNYQNTINGVNKVTSSWCLRCCLRIVVLEHTWCNTFFGDRLFWCVMLDAPLSLENLSGFSALLIPKPIRGNPGSEVTEDNGVKLLLTFLCWWPQVSKRLWLISKSVVGSQSTIMVLNEWEEAWHNVT